MQADDKISVELTAVEWNTVLGLLAEGPFRIVAPLITNIRDQAMTQGASANGGAGEEKRVSN